MIWFWVLVHILTQHSVSPFILIFLLKFLFYFFLFFSASLPYFSTLSVFIQVFSPSFLLLQMSSVSIFPPPSSFPCPSPSFISPPGLFFHLSASPFFPHLLLLNLVFSLSSIPLWFPSLLSPYTLLQPSLCPSSISRYPIANLFIFLPFPPLFNPLRCVLFYLSPWRDPPSVY